MYWNNLRATFSSLAKWEDNSLINKNDLNTIQKYISFNLINQQKFEYKKLPFKSKPAFIQSFIEETFPVTLLDNPVVPNSIKRVIRNIHLSLENEINIIRDSFDETKKQDALEKLSEEYIGLTEEEAIFLAKNKFKSLDKYNKSFITDILIPFIDKNLRYYDAITTQEDDKVVLDEIDSNQEEETLLEDDVQDITSTEYETNEEEEEYEEVEKEEEEEVVKDNSAEKAYDKAAYNVDPSLVANDVMAFFDSIFSIQEHSDGFTRFLSVDGKEMVRRMQRLFSTLPMSEDNKLVDFIKYVLEFSMIDTDYALVYRGLQKAFGFTKRTDLENLPNEQKIYLKKIIDSLTLKTRHYSFNTSDLDKFTKPSIEDIAFDGLDGQDKVTDLVAVKLNNVLGTSRQSINERRARITEHLKTAPIQLIGTLDSSSPKTNFLVKPFFVYFYEGNYYRMNNSSGESMPLFEAIKQAPIEVLNETLTLDTVNNNQGKYLLVETSTAVKYLRASLNPKQASKSYVTNIVFTELDNISPKAAKSQHLTNIAITSMIYSMFGINITNEYAYLVTSKHSSFLSWKPSEDFILRHRDILYSVAQKSEVVMRNPFAIELLTQAMKYGSTVNSASIKDMSNERIYTLSQPGVIDRLLPTADERKAKNNMFEDTSITISLGAVFKKREQTETLTGEKITATNYEKIPFRKLTQSQLFIYNISMIKQGMINLQQLEGNKTNFNYKLQKVDYEEAEIVNYQIDRTVEVLENIKNKYDKVIKAANGKSYLSQDNYDVYMASVLFEEERVSFQKVPKEEGQISSSDFVYIPLVTPNKKGFGLFFNYQLTVMLNGKEQDFSVLFKPFNTVSLEFVERYSTNIKKLIVELKRPENVRRLVDKYTKYQEESIYKIMTAVYADESYLESIIKENTNKYGVLSEEDLKSKLEDEELSKRNEEELVESETKRQETIAQLRRDYEEAVKIAEARNMPLPIKPDLLHEDERLRKPHEKVTPADYALAKKIQRGNTGLVSIERIAQEVRMVRFLVNSTIIGSDEAFSKILGKKYYHSFKNANEDFTKRLKQVAGFGQYLDAHKLQSLEDDILYVYEKGYDYGVVAADNTTEIDRLKSEGYKVTKVEPTDGQSLLTHLYKYFAVTDKGSFVKETKAYYAYLMTNKTATYKDGKPYLLRLNLKQDLENFEQSINSLYETLKTDLSNILKEEISLEQFKDLLYNSDAFINRFNTSNNFIATLRKIESNKNAKNDFVEANTIINNIVKANIDTATKSNQARINEIQKIEIAETFFILSEERKQIEKNLQIIQNLLNKETDKANEKRLKTLLRTNKRDLNKRIEAMSLILRNHPEIKEMMDLIIENKKLRKTGFKDLTQDLHNQLKSVITEGVANLEEVKANALFNALANYEKSRTDTSYTAKFQRSAVSNKFKNGILKPFISAQVEDYSIYVKAASFTPERSLYMETIPGKEKEIEAIYLQLLEEVTNLEQVKYYDQYVLGDSSKIETVKDRITGLYVKLYNLHRPVLGQEVLFKKMKDAETRGIDHVTHNSAHKGATPLKPVQIKRGETFNQTEMPNDKNTVVFGTQLYKILQQDIPFSEEYNINYNGKSTSLAELRDIFNEQVGNIVNLKTKMIQSMILNEDGTLDVFNFAELLKQFVKTTRSFDYYETFFEVLETKEEGKVKEYFATNPEMASVITIFYNTVQKLFNDPTNIKVNGEAYQVVSPSFYTVVETVDGSVVTLTERKNLLDEKGNEKVETTKRPLSSFRAVLINNRLRKLTQEKDTNNHFYLDNGVQVFVDESEVIEYAEIVVPASEPWMREYMADKALGMTKEALEEKYDDRLFLALSSRIPTENKRSISVVRMVDFLPQETGSIIIPSATVQSETGGDNDGDKLQTIRFTATKNEGKWTIEENASFIESRGGTKEEIEEAKKTSILKNNKELKTKSVFSELIDRHSKSKNKAKGFAFADGTLEASTNHMLLAAIRLQNNKFTIINQLSREQTDEATKPYKEFTKIQSKYSATKNRYMTFDIVGINDTIVKTNLSLRGVGLAVIANSVFGIAAQIGVIFDAITISTQNLGFKARYGEVYLDINDTTDIDLSYDFFKIDTIESIKLETNIVKLGQAFTRLQATLGKSSDKTNRLSDRDKQKSLDISNIIAEESSFRSRNQAALMALTMSMVENDLIFDLNFNDYTMNIYSHMIGLNIPPTIVRAFNTHPFVKLITNNFKASTTKKNIIKYHKDLTKLMSLISLQSNTEFLTAVRYKNEYEIHRLKEAALNLFRDHNILTIHTIANYDSQVYENNSTLTLEVAKKIIEKTLNLNYKELKIGGNIIEQAIILLELNILSFTEKEVLKLLELAKPELEISMTMVTLSQHVNKLFNIRPLNDLNRSNSNFNYILNIVRLFNRPFIDNITNIDSYWINQLFKLEKSKKWYLKQSTSKLSKFKSLLNSIMFNLAIGIEVDRENLNVRNKQLIKDFFEDQFDRNNEEVNSSIFFVELINKLNKYSNDSDILDAEDQETLFMLNALMLPVIVKEIDEDGNAIEVEYFTFYNLVNLSTHLINEENIRNLTKLSDNYTVKDFKNTLEVIELLSYYNIDKEFKQEFSAFKNDFINNSDKWSNVLSFINKKELFQSEEYREFICFLKHASIKSLTTVSYSDILNLPTIYTDSNAKLDLPYIHNMLDFGGVDAYKSLFGLFAPVTKNMSAFNGIGKRIKYQLVGLELNEDTMKFVSQMSQMVSFTSFVNQNTLATAIFRVLGNPDVHMKRLDKDKKNSQDSDLDVFVLKNTSGLAQAWENDGFLTYNENTNSYSFTNDQVLSEGMIYYFELLKNNLPNNLMLQLLETSTGVLKLANSIGDRTIMKVELANSLEEALKSKEMLFYYNAEGEKVTTSVPISQAIKTLFYTHELLSKFEYGVNSPSQFYPSSFFKELSDHQRKLDELSNTNPEFIRDLIDINSELIGEKMQKEYKQQKLRFAPLARLSPADKANPRIRYYIRKGVFTKVVSLGGKTYQGRIPYVSKNFTPGAKVNTSVYRKDIVLDPRSPEKSESTKNAKSAILINDNLVVFKENAQERDGDLRLYYTNAVIKSAETSEVMYAEIGNLRKKSNLSNSPLSRIEITDEFLFNILTKMKGAFNKEIFYAGEKVYLLDIELTPRGLREAREEIAEFLNDSELITNEEEERAADLLMNNAQNIIKNGEGKFFLITRERDRKSEKPAFQNFSKYSFEIYKVESSKETFQNLNLVKQLDGYKDIEFITYLLNDEEKLLPAVAPYSEFLLTNNTKVYNYEQTKLYLNSFFANTKASHSELTIEQYLTLINENDSYIPKERLEILIAGLRFKNVKIFSLYNSLSNTIIAIKNNDLVDIYSKASTKPENLTKVSPQILENLDSLAEGNVTNILNQLEISRAIRSMLKETVATFEEESLPLGSNLANDILIIGNKNDASTSSVMSKYKVKIKEKKNYTSNTILYLDSDLENVSSKTEKTYKEAIIKNINEVLSNKGAVILKNETLLLSYLQDVLFDELGDEINLQNLGASIIMSHKDSKFNRDVKTRIENSERLTEKDIYSVHNTEDLEDLINKEKEETC